MTDKLDQHILEAVALLEAVGFEVKQRKARLHPTISSSKFAPGDEFILRRNGHRCMVLGVGDSYGRPLYWDFHDKKAVSYTSTSEVIVP
jgi:hypothetical protein